MKVSISEINLNEVIEYIYSIFRREAEGKGINLGYKHEFPLKEAIVYTDHNKINAILINLLKNAIKFTEKGSIEFGYTKEGTSLIFFVKDTGIGIDNEQKNIILEKFRRISTKLILNNSGDGLGLSISKAYVELLGGKIWVESELNKGSVFHFSIPYNFIETEQINNKEKKGLLQNAVGAIKNLKILIVEDNEISAILIRALLSNFAREIITVKSGTKAVESCQDIPDIDLILMDIRMPEMDGYETTKQIRLFDREVIIVAQTALTLNEEYEKAIDAGCNDFISKPFTKNGFERLLKKHFKPA